MQKKKGCKEILTKIYNPVRGYITQEDVVKRNLMVNPFFFFGLEMEKIFSLKKEKILPC